MSLLQLPAEILTTIFEYVGSQYFRSDLSRLTVCKQWNEFARPACFRYLHITHKTLQRLLSSPYAGSNLVLVQDSAVIMDLELDGFEDWDSILTSRNGSPPIEASPVSSLNGTVGRVRRLSWTTAYNNDLLRLATIIKQSRKLRSLHVLATSEMHESVRYFERRDYLFACAIRPFLSTNNLATLELDLVGTRLVRSEEHGEELHICMSVAAVLTTLLRLRIRMREICADVLNVGQHCKELRLNEIIINLSLSNESPLITSATHATCCNTLSRGFLQLKNDIEEQARVLATQMANPRMVRVLAHTLPNIKMQAFDVLTGTTIMLEDDAEWDDDGEVIEEAVSDEESDIPDLSSDSDA